jgi:two-component sensor histidine kinase
LRALCGNLSQRREGVRVEPDADSAVMTHERVVPLGLIVNELATNALKYAFPGGPPRHRPGHLPRRPGNG